LWRSHPPYSPDLSPADFFLFPTLKTTLKGKRLQDVKNMAAELIAVPLQVLAACFQTLFKRATDVFK
jgi:hypothetical protein